MKSKFRVVANPLNNKTLLRSSKTRLALIALLAFILSMIVIAGRGWQTSTSAEESKTAALNNRINAKSSLVCSLGINLIANGNAESDPAATGDGTTDHDVSGWENETGAFTIVRYNAPDGFPTSSGPGPSNRGAFFFDGGTVASSSASQVIDVSDCSAQINSGGQEFNLSGFLGGYQTQNDQTKVTVTFKDSASNAIGAASIGPVTATERGNATGLFLRNTTGTVPVGTRMIEVVQEMTRFTGTRNDGYADNLSLVLTPPPACAALPSGIVAWWKAEGNANDFLGVNNGNLQNGIAFTSGAVGQAFSLDGIDDHVKINGSSSLDVGASNGLTVEAWINPADASVQKPIVEWHNGTGFGVHFWISVFRDNDLYANIVGTNGAWNRIATAAPVITTNEFQHVAVTYDKSSGIARLFRNGVMVAETNLGILNPATAPNFDVYIGQRGAERFKGSIDEPSIYNRVLSTAEIQAIYAAGSSGKCNSFCSYTLSPTSANIAASGDSNRSFTITTTENCPWTAVSNADWITTNSSGSGSGTVNFMISANPGATRGGTISVGNQTFTITQSANGTFVYNSHSYRLTSGAKSWSDAEAEAVAAGGHLVTVNDAAEQAFLVNTFLNGANDARPLWLGINDAATEGNFVWASGEPVSYTNWNSGEPNNGNGSEDFGTINWHRAASSGSTPKGTWNDTPLNGTSGLGGSSNGLYLGIIEVNTVSACAPSPSNLLSWWKAEGNANDVLGGNNGVLQNGATFSGGLVGQSFNFDGIDDHVTVSRTIQDDFTIEFWLNTTQIITGSGTQWYSGRGLVDAEVSSVTNDFGVSLLNGKVYFGTGNPDRTIISGVVADGNWHHIVASRKRSTGEIKLYVDGAQTATGTGGTQSLTAAARIVLGRIQVNNNPFQGKLDEVSIYNRVLSLSEIQAIYSAGAIGKCGVSAIQSLTLNPNPVSGGQTSTGTIILAAPAPPEGAMVNLSSDNPDVATIPASITIAAGQTSGTFQVTTFVPVQDTTALITASYQSGTASASLTVIAPRADLTVFSADAPNAATTDAAFNVSWTVKNQGAARAVAPWTDRIYISADNQIGSDTLLAEFPFNLNLEPNQTADRIQTVTIPRNAVSANNGQYFLIIRTDAANQVNEDIENNNFVARPINVTRPPKPDLVVESIVAPNTAFFDQTIQVQWTVKNTGGGATNASDWRDYVYLSVDNVPEIEDPFKISVANVSYLAAGEGYTATAEIRIPKGLVGQYKIIAWTDSDGSNHRTNIYPHQVNEENEENNFGIARPIQINAPPLPDLQTFNVVAPEEVFAGGQMTLNWRVENRGNAATPQNQIDWRDKIYLSQDTTLNVQTDRLIGSRARSGALAQNEGYTVNNYNITLPNDIAGDWYVFVVADGDNQVYEFSGENNNADYDRQQPGSPVRIRATPPDLIIPSPINAPASGQTGQSIAVNWTVLNQGAFDAAPSWFDAIYLSADQTLNTETDTLLTSVFRSSPLGAGLSYNASANVSLPSCLSGTYYLFVVSDSRRQIFEFDPKQNAENNNSSQPRAIIISNAAPDLLVTTVSHSPNGSAGQPLGVNWTVANQGVGLTVSTRWTDRIYLSQTQTLNTSAAILIGSFERNGALNNGESYTRTENLTVPNTAQGSYFVIVLTDAKGEIEECVNNGNNTGTGAQPVVINNNLPDLVVQNASLQSNFIGGQTVGVSWTVANSGTVPANNATWGDAVYFSTDELLGSDDRRLATTPVAGPLLVGGVYNRQAQAILPVVAPGNYFLIVQTDYLNNVFEGQGENNNLRTVALPVEIPAVDLSVTAISAPESAFSGQNMTINWTVTNSGSNRSVGSQWTDAIVLSLDQIDDPSDRVIGYLQHDGALNGAESYNAGINAFVPAGLAGQYYVFIRADRNNQLAESNENNNASDLKPILLELTPPSDLIVTNVVQPVNASPGELAVFNWTVQNIGNNSATGLWTDTIYLSTDQLWDIDDILVARQARSGPIPPGQSYNGTTQATLPAVNLGNYFVIVRTDIRNRVIETSEANNVGISGGTTIVDVPELQLGVPLSTTLVTKQERYYKFNSPANETVRVTLDGQDGSSNELYTRFGLMASRNSYDFLFDRPYEPDQRILIPNTNAGTYYNLIRSENVPNNLADVEDRQVKRQETKLIDSKQAVNAENVTVKAEIVPFSVTKVFPSRGGNAGKVTVKIEGSKFEWHSKIILKNAAGAIVINQEGIFTDPTKLRAQLDLRGVPAGQYSIGVMLPDGRQTIWSESFSVVEGGKPDIVVSTSGPVTARIGRSSYFLVHYQNKGLIDFEEPILVCESDEKVRIDADLPFGWAAELDDRTRVNPVEVVILRDIPPDTSGTIGFYVTPLEGGTNIPFKIVLARNPTTFSSDARNLQNDNNPDIVIDPRFMGGTAKALSPGDVLPEPGTIIFTREQFFGHMALVVRGNDGQLMVFENRPHPLLFLDTGHGGGTQLTPYNEVITRLFPNGQNPKNNWAATYKPNLTAQEVEAINIWANNHVGTNKLGYDLSLKCTEAAAMGLEATGLDFRFDALTSPADIWEELSGRVFSPDTRDASIRLPKDWRERLNALNDLDPLLKGQYDPWSCFYLGLGCLPGFGPGFGGFGFVDGVSPLDPNEKISPRGFGPQHFISKNAIPYTINFENIPAATASAQRIRITDQLDTNLDRRTFRLKEIGFGSYSLQVPENRAFFQQRVQLGAEFNNILADISAGVDISTGEVGWTLTAIDPATGEQPNSASIGLLPPNDHTGRGQGYVTYTVQPKQNAPTGTEISNSATIIFDTEEPINTNTVSNTLDADLPESQVVALPLTSEPVFTVSWSGNDSSNGSGLRSYDVLVSENGGVYQPFINGTITTSVQFTGTRGRTYRFYSIAHDNAGNIEEAPLTADAATTVAGGAFEADVDPRPNGDNNGSVTGADVNQTGRFVAGIDAPDQPTATNEFQRADSAPRSSSGNGSLTVADITQAGRYAAGLDPLQNAGGTISPSLAQPAEKSSLKNNSSPGLVTGARSVYPVRVVRIGNKITVAVELNTSSGDEVANAIGFALNFDPAVLSNPSNIVLGTGATGATLISNSGQAAQGRLGIVLYKPANQTFLTGLQRLVTVDFDVANNAPSTTQISFSNQPVIQDVSGVNADSLPTNFDAAAIPLLLPTAASVTIGGRVMDASGNGIKGAQISMTDGNGIVRTALTNAFGHYRFTDITAGTVVVVSVRAKRYSFTSNTQAVPVNEDVYEINFRADN